jgi:hypothetical protein
VPLDIEPLQGEAGPARDRVMRANHERANRFDLATAEVDAKEAGFALNLNVPEKVPGIELILRAYASTDHADGQGILRLAVGR